MVIAIFGALALSIPAQPQFPDDFLGHWQGDLVVSSPGQGATARTTMDLDLSKLDGGDAKTFRYAITYGGQPTREYRLRAVDAARGHWQVDEQNGILLDGFWTGASFECVFEIGGVRLASSLSPLGKQLQFRIVTHRPEVLRTTGPEKEVTVHRVIGEQHARLSKKRERKKIGGAGRI